MDDVPSVKISYLVAVTNMVGTIGRCLRSLVGEDEVVVTDGNSIDGTSQVIDGFPVVHLYDDGMGLPAARNIGVKACTGDYVVIVDADQWVPRRFNKRLKELLAKEEYDTVQCREVWTGNSIWAEAQQASWFEVATLREDWVYWPRVLRRTLIFKAGGYDENFKGFEDLDLWNRIKKFNPRVCKTDLVIFSDASDLSVFAAFKRGIYSHVSLALYISRHPSEWQKVLSVAPIGLFIDMIMGLRIALRSRSIKLAVAALALRMAMSLGRFVGVFLGTPIGRAFTRLRTVREVARIPSPRFAERASLHIPPTGSSVIWRALDKKFISKARPYIPFTPPNVAWQISDKEAKSILDVGCGTGEPMKLFKRLGRFLSVGIDIHLPYLREAKAKECHDQYILCDIRRLPFRRKSFDLVLCLEVLEHLGKRAGRELITHLEEIARRQVIISAPVSQQIQKPYDNNPNQEHKSGWRPNEFAGLGFSVRGLGFPSINGRRITGFLPRCLRPLGHILWVITSPFVYFFPESGGSMVCSKELSFEAPTTRERS